MAIKTNLQLERSFSKGILYCFLFLGQLSFSQILKISSYGLEDSSKAIEMAMDSSIDTVLIDITHKPIYVKPLRFRNLNNKVLILKKGTQIIAEPGAFPKQWDALMSFVDCKGITIIGNGGELCMNKEEYVYGEWRHGINLRGSENFIIKNLTIRGSGGDGIYLAGSETKNYCENILIDSVHSINNKRQGLSIISAKKVKIKHSLFAQTSGTLPGAGLDIEPNRPEDVIIDIVVSNCIFQDNYGAGIKVELHKLTSKSSNISIVFQHCIIRRNTSPQHPRVHAAIDFQANKEDPVKGEVNIENCVFESSEWGLLYSRKRADAYAVRFTDCVLRDMNLSGSSSMVYLEVPDYHKNFGDLGGFTFERLLLENTKLSRFLRVRGSKLGTLKSLREVSINVIMEHPPHNLVEYINYNSDHNKKVSLKISIRD